MPHDHTHHHGAGFHGEAHGHLADVLDLDAHVLHDLVHEVLDWTAAFAGTPSTITDLGSGTGTWAVALAERFDQATVTALDISEQMLALVRDKAEDRGLSDRVHTVVADIDSELPGGQPVDLAWAALSLHEVPNPERALRNIYDALKPGGVLTIIEMEAPPTFLPRDIRLGQPSLEHRISEAVHNTRVGVPLHPEWSPRLEKVGFESLGRRSFSVDPAPPYPESVGRYADTYLRRVRPGAEDTLSAEDLSTLDTLLAHDGPHSLLRRQDFEVRGSRTVWVARRPGE